MEACLLGFLLSFFIIIPACNKLDNYERVKEQKWKAYRDECIKYTTIQDCKDRYVLDLPMRKK